VYGMCGPGIGHAARGARRKPVGTALGNYRAFAARFRSEASNRFVNRALIISLSEQGPIEVLRDMKLVRRLGSVSLLIPKLKLISFLIMLFLRNANAPKLTNNVVFISR